jgi:hypothetical protein
MDTKQIYQIIITATGERSYFEILNYVFEYYSFDRANKIAIELLEHPQILKQQPYLGKIESLLVKRGKNYRFLVFKRTNQITVKIIYSVDELTRKIYITDFFPSEMSPEKVIERT